MYSCISHNIRLVIVIDYLISVIVILLIKRIVISLFPILA